jgi:hypothetical protein
VSYRNEVESLETHFQYRISLTTAPGKHKMDHVSYVKKDFFSPTVNFLVTKELELILD